MDNFLFLPRALDAAVSDAAFATLFGLVLAPVWLQDDVYSSLRDRLRRATILCAAAMAVALIAQTCLTTATMIGSSAPSTVGSRYTMVMTGTHAGRTLLCNCVISLALLLLLVWRREGSALTRTGWLLALLGILAAARAASGHPSADGDFTVPELVQFVHLVSIAIWAGGVIAAGFVVLPELLHAHRPAAVAAFLRRLSRTVTVALLLVVLTGLYNSYRSLAGSLAPLLHSQWGGLLDLKLVLVCAAVGLGAFSRQSLRGNRDLSPLQASRLGTALRVEAALMVLILAVSALLANTEPPDSM